jgi:hypothetical protein
VAVATDVTMGAAITATAMTSMMMYIRMHALAAPTVNDAITKLLVKKRK